MSSPTKITAIFTAHSGKAEELKRLLVEMASPSRAEPGNLRWDIWQAQVQPECYVLDELYVDDAAVAVHRQTPHYQEFIARVTEVADRQALVLSPIMVTQAHP